MSEKDTESSIILAKSVAMFTLFITTFFLGLSPIFLAKKLKWDSNMKNNKFAQILLSLGGGVLMSTTFIHLIPEVRENIENIDAFKDIDIPLAETLTCVGFFMIYLIEECVHLYLHKRHGNDVEIVAIRRSVSLRGSDADVELENVRNNTEHSHLSGDEDFLSSLRGLMVVFALSIHSIFEGLSVGLEENTRNVWYMFGAIGAHKFVLAISVGVELLSSGIKTKMILIYVFTFASVSPLGILIGIIVTNTNNDPASSDIPPAILQGFAAGTLLYVIFFEILKKNEDSDVGHRGIAKFLAVLVGFSMMYLVTVFFDV